MPMWTHYLDVSVEPVSYHTILLPHLRDQVNGVPFCVQDITLMWTSIPSITFGCRFGTISPYNDTLTIAHAKSVLSNCASILSQITNGSPLELSFTVVRILNTGVLQGMNGVVANKCRKNCCRPTQLVPQQPSAQT